MSPVKTKDKKVEVSFTNWVLGGSLLTVTSTEEHQVNNVRRRSASRKVVVTEVDSDENEIIDLEALKKEKEERRKAKRDRHAARAKTEAEAAATAKKVEEEAKASEKKDEKKDDAKPEEKKTEDKGKDEKKSDGDKGSDGGKGWTKEQDAKIRDMKAANKAWKDICAEVEASKKDIQQRWKELQKMDEEKPKEDDKKDEAAAGEGGGDDGGFGDFGDIFGDGGGDGGSGSGWNDWEQIKDDGGSNSWDAAPEANSDNGKKQNGNGGNFFLNNGAKNENNQNGGNGSKGAEKQNGGNVQNEGGQANPAKPADPEPMPKGRLQPNDIWSKDDCEVLEYLMAKYSEHKWLAMQAGFFNWTGRMITAETIEKKFRDDGAS